MAFTAEQLAYAGRAAIDFFENYNEDHTMYQDKRTDAQAFDVIRRAHIGKDENRMAAEIRATLEARKGGLLTKVRTDAPLSLTGQWDQRGSARHQFLGTLAVAAFVVLMGLMLTGCGGSEPEAPAIDAPVTVVNIKGTPWLEYHFYNGTYCIQEASSSNLQCDFSQRKLDNLEF